MPALETPPEDWEVEYVERVLLRNIPLISVIVRTLRDYYGILTTAREVMRILEKFVGSATYPLEFTDKELKILKIIRTEFITG